jgi:hypothetical protein
MQDGIADCSWRQFCCPACEAHLCVAAGPVRNCCSAEADRLRGGVPLPAEPGKWVMVQQWPTVGEHTRACMGGMRPVAADRFGSPIARSGCLRADGALYAMLCRSSRAASSLCWRLSITRSCWGPMKPRTPPWPTCKPELTLHLHAERSAILAKVFYPPLNLPYHDLVGRPSWMPVAMSTLLRTRHSPALGLPCFPPWLLLLWWPCWRHCRHKR